VTATDNPWQTTRAQRKLRESQEKRRGKRNGWGGARPGAGATAKAELRKRVGTRLTDAERARIEAWGESRGLGFSEALREAALMTASKDE
jgi:hypothetical protein